MFFLGIFDIYEHAAKHAKDLEDIETEEESSTVVALSSNRQTFVKKTENVSDYDTLMMNAQIETNEVIIDEQSPCITDSFVKSLETAPIFTQPQSTTLTVPSLDQLSAYMESGSDASKSKFKNYINNRTINTIQFI